MSFRIGPEDREASEKLFGVQRLARASPQCFEVSRLTNECLKSFGTLPNRKSSGSKNGQLADREGAHEPRSARDFGLDRCRIPPEHELAGRTKGSTRQYGDRALRRRHGILAKGPLSIPAAVGARHQKTVGDRALGARAIPRHHLGACPKSVSVGSVIPHTEKRIATPIGCGPTEASAGSEELPEGEPGNVAHRAREHPHLPERPESGAGRKAKLTEGDEGRHGGFSSLSNTIRCLHFDSL